MMLTINLGLYGQHDHSQHQESQKNENANALELVKGKLVEYDLYVNDNYFTWDK